MFSQRLPRLTNAEHRALDKANHDRIVRANARDRVFWDDEDVPMWGGGPRNYDSNGKPVRAGWYYETSVDFVGPFETEDEAYRACLDYLNGTDS